MPHFFITSKSVNNNKICITDKENYNHIVRSLRTMVGEKLLLIDENEVEYTTKVVDINSKNIICDIISSEKSKRDLSYNIYLAQSPLKSDAQNTIIEKSTELGVRGVIPIYTDNCSLKKSVASQKIQKWQKIMVGASKQCERANIPHCFDLATLDEILENKSFDKIIVLCERNTNGSLKSYLKNADIKQNENILVIIGPEGGFSEREFNLFKDKHLPMLSLGDLILKAETAVIVTLGNIIYDVGR